ncbi:MAG TPA: MBL fold metallo-hydrolase [Acidobacteriaceae bacterium]|nr:MBL fold metallo-hydrolase [Acidobacteriaceae bacterium]
MEWGACTEHMPHYVFSKNNPYDREAPVELVLPARMPSRAFMDSIRTTAVPEDGLAIWFLGQNGFLLKAHESPLIGIDLYLTNSCARRFADLPFRLDRQLPVFIEPEDLEIDVFCTTHSHQDHADPETLQRLKRTETMQFVGPWESLECYRNCGIPEAQCRLLHPNQRLQLGGGVDLKGTFALPTDATDLNHLGLLFRFTNGITYYNSGDTGECALLSSLLPHNVDICSICINGGFHNLAPMDAAHIVHQIGARVAIPCHYDMMVNNAGDPEMLRTALHVIGSETPVHVMDYYVPWIYRKHRRAPGAAE